MKKIPRMLFTACATVLAGALLAPATAQTFPAKPVKMLAGTAPGGGTDFVARPAAQESSKSWGQSGGVENRTGESGTNRGGELVHAKHDRHTIGDWKRVV